MLQGEHRTSKSNWGSSLRNNIALSVGKARRNHALSFSATTPQEICGCIIEIQWILGQGSHRKACKVVEFTARWHFLRASERSDPGKIKGRFWQVT